MKLQPPRRTYSLLPAVGLTTGTQGVFAPPTAFNHSTAYSRKCLLFPSKWSQRSLRRGYKVDISETRRLSPKNRTPLRHTNNSSVSREREINLSVFGFMSVHSKVILDPPPPTPHPHVYISKLVSYTNLPSGFYEQ